MFDNSYLKEKIKELPITPGVYIMKDSLGNIIYIGKAKNLKRRVSQYFINSSDRSPKIEKLVLNVHSIDHLLCDTELEALLLECNLIKKHMPPYNRLLKNDKAYSYIRINLEEDIPGIEAVFYEEEDGAIYFGPYTSKNTVEKAIDALKRHTPLRKCNKVLFNKRGCFYSQQCGAKNLCQEKLDTDYQVGTEHYVGTKDYSGTEQEKEKENYKITIDKVIKFIKGEDLWLLKDLEKKMEEAALELNFEEASELRDHINTLKYIVFSQESIKDSVERRNLLVLHKVLEDFYKIFFISGNKLLYTFSLKGREVLGQVPGQTPTENPTENQNENFINSWGQTSNDNCGQTPGQTPNNLLKSIEEILEAWEDLYKNTELIGKHTVSKEELDEQQIIYGYLKGKKNDIKFLEIPEALLKQRQIEKLIDIIIELFYLT